MTEQNVQNTVPQQSQDNEHETLRAFSDAIRQDMLRYQRLLDAMEEFA